MHAVEFLQNPDTHPPGALVVLVGNESYLKQQVLNAVRQVVLGAEADDMGLVRFAGDDVELKDVTDELLTISMWGGPKLVYVESAADFVSKYRSGLESYVAKPARSGLLVLDVKSWPGNTRIAKAVAKTGLKVECSELKGVALRNWLVQTAAEGYEKQLSRDAAALMLERAGSELALLDRELAKLASYVGERARIGVDDVRALVGGWKTDTTWQMLDAVRDGRIAEALVCLEKLLRAGEPAIKILGGINFVFRKFATATELSRTGTNLNSALKQAGILPFAVAPASNYLRRIGRPAAERIYRQLTTADEDLKGRSTLDEKTILERLLIELSGVQPQPLDRA